eukprot:CAMPEP_0183299844 /NCGR_PEP_ID=MMETSP0160_2-20130417/6457_1 /TAXON_ID=2839 ORGANISM="Odontella Sinensis, Strain Grunow 1884" /NCGR_SAMPLE_ID=MMETSP0160_2 /ASSEMBLY_ACC=CAM_ASM_000250 /LENGTH=176 /DNA_ID=CAMNT_0025462163 /DNA_START=90 /DNA_END=616 /DNA_ORIENTATION=-
MATAGIKKLATQYEGPGTDQLGKYLGKTRTGDTCQVHLKGRIIPGVQEKRPGLFCCIPSSTEFIDTVHMTKRVTVTLREDGIKTYDGLYRGLHECLLTMKFGEESAFFVPSCLAFGEKGLSKSSVERRADEDRIPGGVSFLAIGPDQDLEVEIVFFRLCRDGKWHNRVVKNRPNFL